MRVWALSLMATACAFSADRVTVTGKVADASGKPVEHATVLVYEAGVRQGYSIYCPTCYPDCGKHAVTDSEGNYTIPGLNGDLIFNLLVMHDGYSAAMLKKVDPAQGAAETAALKPRAPVENPAQYVRGHLVDGHGRPIPDAVVEQQGVTFKRPDGQVGTRFGGNDGWIDALAVTNEKGDFEIAFGQPAIRMILNVNPRGMSSKLFTLATGPDRHSLTVTDGAIVRGRLLHDGKPVANAEIGVASHSRNAATAIREMRIGTQEDGTFILPNIPPGRVYELYVKMESLSARDLAAQPIEFETRDDGQEIDVGDIATKPAYTLRGRVVLSDGKEIPPNMRINLFSDRLSDTQSLTLAPDGRFEFRGLAGGVYELTPSVKGYKLADDAAGEILVRRDIDNRVITVYPAPPRL